MAAVKLEEIVQNEILLRMYAKKRCNKCRGKGYVHLDNGKGTPQEKYVCPCVVKNVRRG